MDNQQEAFLSLSVYLTGFERVELLGTGMLEEYYKYVVCKAGKFDPNALMREVKTSRTLGPIAKNIIRLWYMGTWRKDPADEVASAQAYQEGLIWKVMRTHPPGAKQPGFGTWSELPL